MRCYKTQIDIIGGVKVDLFGLWNRPEFWYQICPKVEADFQKLMPKGYCISPPKYFLFWYQISPSHHKILLFFDQIFPNKTSSPQSISLLPPILNLSLSPSLSSHTHQSFFCLSLSLYSPNFLSLSCSHTPTLAFSPRICSDHYPHQTSPLSFFYTQNLSLWIQLFINQSNSFSAHHENFKHHLEFSPIQCWEIFYFILFILFFSFVFLCFYL